MILRDMGEATVRAVLLAVLGILLIAGCDSSQRFKYEIKEFQVPLDHFAS